jgi:terminase large subunit-like protein
VSGKFTVNAGWDHVPHLSEEQKKEELDRIQPFQRKARSQGIPTLGAGAIYPVPEEVVLCDPFEIKDYMPQAYALDVGWNRTAAVWGALDPNTDILYLYSEHYRGEAEPPVHAAAIRARGVWIPGVIDPAARGRGQKDGTRLISDYQQLGLDTLSVSENALEAGIYEVWTRMTTGRLKVFRTLQNWIAEFRFYQRDDKGRVKDGQADHLMDTTRYLVLSGLAKACVRPANMWTTGRAQQMHNFDYDPMAGR